MGWVVVACHPVQPTRVHIGNTGKEPFMAGFFGSLSDDDEPQSFFGGYRPYAGGVFTDAAKDAGVNLIPVIDRSGASDVTGQDSRRRAVIVNLPGLPNPTYLDSEFAARLKRFENYATDRGVQPQYISGYRSPEQQDAIRNSGQGVTPARHSLHSAGLAADVQYRGRSAEEQQILRDAAIQAGLSWGGTFRHPDPNHFYFDPGGDRQQLIEDFTGQVHGLQSKP